MMNSSLYKDPVDPANWFGIRKDATVLGYSKVYQCVWSYLPAVHCFWRDILLLNYVTFSVFLPYVESTKWSFQCFYL